MIVGISGFINSGKDTIADYLVNIHEFRRDSFAGTLKDAVAAVFGWDREMLEGRSKQAREWRDQIDAWWANKLDMPNLTPRLVLQLWGTEVCRRGFHDNIWITSLENKLRNTKDSVVISDCRFPNEILSIRNAGGMVVRVVRGSEPDWYNDAVIANTDLGHAEWQQAKNNMAQRNIHVSETAWVGSKFDYVIKNNGSLDQLYAQVNDLLLNHQHG